MTLSYLSQWKSPLLKRADEELTSTDLQQQYGFMTDAAERMHRQQSQILGRPLTRAEQRTLNKQFSGLDILNKRFKLYSITVLPPVFGLITGGIVGNKIGGLKGAVIGAPLLGIAGAYVGSYMLLTQIFNK